MISDVNLLCTLTAELTQSYTHGTCVRGYTHLRHFFLSPITAEIFLTSHLDIGSEARTHGDREAPWSPTMTSIPGFRYVSRRSDVVFISSEIQQVMTKRAKRIKAAAIAKSRRTRNKTRFSKSDSGVRDVHAPCNAVRMKSSIAL